MGTARRRFVGARARRVFHESIPPSKRNRLGKPLRAMCNVRRFDKLVPRRPNMRLVWLYTKIRLGAKKSRLRTCRIVGHLRCVSTFVASGSRTTALRSTEIAASLSCTLNANKFRQQTTRCKRRCSRANKLHAPRSPRPKYSIRRQAAINTAHHHHSCKRRGNRAQQNHETRQALHEPRPPAKPPE